jgi:hypothetical protein
MTPTAQGTMWVCVDCLMARESEPPESPDREPWGLDPSVDVTLGLLSTEHDTPCGSFDGPDGDFLGGECECETHDFSWQPCDGCGSTLGGSRHAYTMWD